MSCMITHKVQQGTQAWLDLRAAHHTASEANAMMGACSHMSRMQLLDQKKSGIVPEPTSYEKNLFALGHKLEAMARPIVEKILDEDLFQVVATRDDLLASFDGLTLMGDIGFEHKMWNESLAAQVREGVVPDTHVWQLEQQLYVGDLEKIIFVVSNGTEEQMVYCWYESDPVKRKQLIQGWAKFEKDLETHVIGPRKLEGKTLPTLPALAIQITSAVLSSNLDEYTRSVIQMVESVNTDLTTDQDFADAKSAVKAFQNLEKTITETKKGLLTQSEAFYAMMNALDEIGGHVRQKRLDLDKLVKAQTEVIKQNAINESAERILAHANEQPFNVLHLIEYDLALAIKGKKTLDGAKDALFKEASRVIAEIDLKVEQINAGLALIEEKTKGFEFLFNHKQQLAADLIGEELEQEIARVIEDYQAHLSASPEAKAEVERLLTQASDQKQVKKVEPVEAIKGNNISAADLNALLHFDHADLAAHLFYAVQDEYVKSDAATMVKTMIAHLEKVHESLS